MSSETQSFPARRNRPAKSFKRLDERSRLYQAITATRCGGIAAARRGWRRPCVLHLQANFQQIVMDPLPCWLAFALPSGFSLWLIIALSLWLAFALSLWLAFALPSFCCGTTMHSCLGGPVGGLGLSFRIGVKKRLSFFRVLHRLEDHVKAARGPLFGIFRVHQILGKVFIILPL